jgi:hypothetical protein
MTPPVSVLIVSRGHFFDRNAFFAMFEPMDGVRATHVEHPAAGIVLRPGNLDQFDTVLFYDMSGIPGLGVPDDADPQGQPSPDYARSIQALLDRGTGIVLLNHATVSWPAWPLWRRISGSSYLLAGGELAGERLPGSGYRGGHGPHPNATFRLLPQSAHPVLAGLEGGFEITDELYLKSPGFESRVVPLLRADYPFVSDNFSPPPLAPAAEQANWVHPPGSDLVVWANACSASPVVTCELGDRPEAFANEGFRTLLRIALCWTASSAARDWATSFRPA